MKPHRGTLILVLGILGLVICGPLAIVAWVLGTGDLKQIDAGLMDPTGRICGIVGTVLFAISIIAVGIFFFLGLGVALLSHHNH